MIFARIMRNEITRKSGPMVVVFLFILLSTLLVAGGSSLIVELSGALERLFSQARAPHFIQMHSGEMEAEAIAEWAQGNAQVEAHQVTEMITVDGSALYLGATDVAEAESVMDVSFVVQNGRFDYLLTSDNEIAEIPVGGVGLPIYYAEELGLGIGDKVRVARDEFQREYTVTEVIRDAQMNPAIVHSKRFLLNLADYEDLKSEFTDSEYLVAFRLNEPGRIDEFSRAYEESGLPSRGPAVDHQLFKLLNGLSDGIVAAVVVVLSLLLMVIAMLCLRFTILATLEEDYREIGVMKAIGMPRGKIRSVYISKYVFLGGAGALLGYLASFPLSGVLTENITTYVGTAPVTAAKFLVPLVAAMLILFLTLLAALVVMRRFGRISAVEALRAGMSREEPRPGSLLTLRRAKLWNINAFLGVRDALQRFRLFGLLTFVFFFAAAITLVPVHFLSTMSSPDFVTYMGIGQSDIRIDLRQSENVEQRFEEILDRLAVDEDVSRAQPLVSSQFSLVRENGEIESLTVETGDLSLFPLDYLQGKAPDSDNEIALSYLNSQELEKDLGDRLTLKSKEHSRTVEVVGIYQDITDGGRTAKAAFPHNPGNIVALTVNLEMAPGVSVEQKVREYSQAFHPARVTGLESYLHQTLGNTVDQLEKVTIGAVIVGVLISVLITSLFLRMLISKDARRIAIMKSLGFSLRAVRFQYLTTALVLLILGIGAGTIFSNTIGQEVVSFLWSFMGAAHIEFVIDPLRAYLLMPLLLATAVGLTTLSAVRGIKDHSIAATIAE